MKFLFLFISILLTLYVFPQSDSELFYLQGKDIITQRIQKQFTEDTFIRIDTIGLVSGLAISGLVNFENEADSYIRVTARDQDGLEYMVFESFPLMEGTKKRHLNNTAYESILLNNVALVNINIRLHKANIFFESFSYKKPQEMPQYGTEGSHVLSSQAKFLADKLNKNLQSRRELWRAAKTNLSDLTFEEKKSMFAHNVPMLYGLEYYSGGIFYMPNALQNLDCTETSGTEIVDSWDWRNRHGKNWMTPVKDQGDCGSCWAFGAVGTLEAYINLYYNRILNYDLSEQEIVSCSNTGSCDRGGNARSAMAYIEQHGIVEEDCFSYTERDDNCSNKCPFPSEIISIDSHNNLYGYSDETLKRLLFRAPIGISISPWSHAIVLAGYKTIHEGDTVINVPSISGLTIVPNGSPLIGRTAWLIKNSWGIDPQWGCGDGYGYVVFNMSDTRNGYSLSGKIHSNIYTDADIICEDADGDGYYFWGIGPKPSNCPSWIPDEPDGDDSDYAFGPINTFGNLRELNPDLNDTIFIDNDTILEECKNIHNHIRIRNNSTLEIRDSVECYANVSIIIDDESYLKVKGGSIKNAIIKSKNGSNVEISESGNINIPPNQKCFIPLGARMKITSGKIM